MHVVVPKLIWARDVFNTYGKGGYYILNALYTNEEYTSLRNDVCKTL